MKLYLVRHGMTKENELKLYSGRTDTSLSHQGIEVLKSIRTRYHIGENAVLVSSPMKRCVETCHILFEHHKIHKYYDTFREIDFGDFEGKDYETLKEDKRYCEWLDHYETLAPPNGEGYKAFVSRVLTGYEQLLNDYKDAEEVILVAHGGVVKGIMSEVVNQEISFYHWDAPYGLGYIVDTDKLKYNKI